MPPESLAHAWRPQQRAAVSARTGQDGEMDYQIGSLRAFKREFRYGVRTVLGKSIYWIPGYSALVAMCEDAFQPSRVAGQGLVVSDD